MDQTTYQYFFTGLTLLFWLSPIILLVVVSATFYVLKGRKPKQQHVTFAKENFKGLPKQTVS